MIHRSGQLPNDVLLARKGLDPSVSVSIRDAITGSSDEFVAAILSGTDNQKYQRMSFDQDVKDEDYEVVRQMFRGAGLDQFAEGGSK